jgi:hypothetical protein
MIRKPIEFNEEEILQSLKDVGIEIVPLTEEDLKARQDLADSIYISGHGLDWEDSNDIAQQLYFYGYRLMTANYVTLPCNVGDIVYAPHWYWGKYDEPVNGIVPYQITNISISQNKKGVWTKKYRAMEIRNGKTVDWQLNFAFDDIGKTVFLTLEEAEEKWNELSRSEQT